jgi:CBS domain-containing protein
MTCKEIMTANPATCTPTAHVQAVALIMSEEDVGVVPVIDEKSKRLVGLVTDRDLCLEVVAGGKSPQEVRVSTVMSRPLATCLADDNLQLCLDLMKEHQLRRIPIIDESGHCVGIISQRDIALHVSQPQEIHETIREISRSHGSKAA